MSRAIPVRVARFVSPQDGPGLSVASSCTTNGKWALTYEPEMRLLRVSCTHGDGRKEVGYIPAERLMCMTFADPPEPEKAAEKAKPATK